MKKAVIFDLDGTLVNTLSDIASAVNKMLLHYSLPTHTEPEIQKMIGKGAKNLITQALPEEKRNEEFVLEALEFYRSIYDRDLICGSYVYDGVLDAVFALHEKGVKMAVVSNKDDSHVKQIAEHFFGGIFSYAMGFTPRYPHKPSPESVLAVLDWLGVSPEESVYVGDSAVDVITARNAGMTSVGVTWGFGGETCFAEHRPDVIVSNAKELLQI